jgi:hypothetical protein
MQRMKAESSAVGAVIADLEAVSVQRASACRHQPSVATTASGATGSGSSSWIGCCLHCDIGALDGLAGDRDRLVAATQIKSIEGGFRHDAPFCSATPCPDLAGLLRLCDLVDHSTVPSAPLASYTRTVCASPPAWGR